ncbi:MAG: DEAD/DEAH box helicase [Bacteroidales bacterium]|nr:DEAD/DEAH box helicase [Bacteroidales bacterium]
MTFDEFKLNEQLLDGLYYMGFKNATPIQEQAIPQILLGRDLLGSAQTGTGKTAAFILPILHKLAENPKEGIRTLVIVPTRELAVQIEQQVQGFSYYVDVTSIAVYGGGDSASFTEQSRALKRGAEIVVATPGKLISLLNMGDINLSNLDYLILDEADRMLDMGFFDDIQKIISFLPEKKRQTLMFSATMPSKIGKLAKSILIDPFEIKIAISKPAAGVSQEVYFTYDTQKTPLTKIIIDAKPEYKSILIFTSTRKKVFEIVKQLRNKVYKVEGISSDLDQRERENVLMRFRSRETKVLIATDVLSRGIDIKDINLVINYDVPGDAEDYVHRIGRTARAETKGEAITFVNDDDMYKFVRIERLIEREVPKLALPKELGEGPKYNKNPSKPFKGGFKGKGGNRNRKPSNNNNKGEKSGYKDKKNNNKGTNRNFKNKSNSKK